MDRLSVLRKQYSKFISKYDDKVEKTIWKGQSKKFRNFWSEAILPDDVSISNRQLDEIISILDAKGSRSGGIISEGAAFVGIRQNQWKNLFHGIKGNEELKKKLQEIFTETNELKVANLLDELYDLNSPLHVRRLTGPDAVVINDFLFAYDPDRFVPVMSISDRVAIAKCFMPGNNLRHDSMTWGQSIVKTNSALKSLKTQIPISESNFAFSQFLYSKDTKAQWKRKQDRMHNDVGKIAYIAFGQKSGVYADSYLDEFRRGEWHDWGTPSDYLNGNEDGTLMLFDPDRDGITIELKISEIRHERGAYGYRNMFGPGDFKIYDPPISSDIIRSIDGFVNFRIARTPKWKLTKDQYDEMMSKYSGKIEGRIPESNGGQGYSFVVGREGLTVPMDLNASLKRTMVNSRPFQGEFRNLLLEQFDHQCFICEIDSDILLQASHIKPVSEDISSAGKIANGLLLCLNHHRLFDKGLIAVEDGALAVSRRLKKEFGDYLSEEYQKLTNVEIQKHPRGTEADEFLRWHFTNVFET